MTLHFLLYTHWAELYRTRQCGLLHKNFHQFPIIVHHFQNFARHTGSQRIPHLLHIQIVDLWHKARARRKRGSESDERV